MFLNVKYNVTEILNASTFHTALDGKTVIYAPNAISLPTEMQGTTHLGERLQVSGL